MGWIPALFLPFGRTIIISRDSRPTNINNIEMSISDELIIVLKLAVSFLLGGFIGYDREKHKRDAGIRTYAAVCIGSTLFTAVAEHLVEATAGGRVIAGIVTGIGFLGAGVIYKSNDTHTTTGLTTAATIWCTAAVGVAIGLDMFLIAVFGALALYILLVLERQKWYVKWKKKLTNKKADLVDTN
jgi:putative Mg2+ transporter-C (MgtC) family protein